VVSTSFAALVIIIIGLALRQVGVLREDNGPVLVNLVIYATMPALVFTIIANERLSPGLILVPIAGWMIHFVMLGVGWVIARIRRADRPTEGAILVSTAVGNTGFFGVPLIAASGIGVSLAAAVVYDAFATGIITWTSTVVIATSFGAVEHRVRGIDWAALGRGLAMPPMVALYLGLAWNLSDLGHPGHWIARPLGLLGAATLPLVLLYAGLMLDWRALRRVWPDVGMITVARLGIGALVGLAIGTLLGLTRGQLHTVVLMAAMPTAAMSLVLGVRYGLRRDVLVGAVFVTTVLCTLTLPIVRELIL
jgi:malate permease and related proteins